MTIKWIGRLGVLMLLGLLTNCASITTGTDQEIEVNSEPTAAACVVEQDGKLVASIKATPEKVTVDKSWSNLFITCDKAGYLTDQSQVASEFQGATIGNFLIGGGIGLIIDASNGAMRKYPDSHIAYLVPETFESAEAANTFFDELTVKVTAQNEKQFENTQLQCVKKKSNKATDCDQQVKDMEEALQHKLARVEAGRAKALNKFGS